MSYCIVKLVTQNSYKREYLGAYMMCLHHFPIERRVSKGMGKPRCDLEGLIIWLRTNFCRPRGEFWPESGCGGLRKRNDLERGFQRKISTALMADKNRWENMKSCGWSQNRLCRDVIWEGREGVSTFWVIFSFWGSRISNWHKESQEFTEKAKSLSVSWEQDVNTSLLAVVNNLAVHAEEGHRA